MQNCVAITEVALAFVLLIGSGLMLRSFLELQRVDPGYDPHGVLTFLLMRDWPFTQRERGQVLMREIRSRLPALPGVESVGASDCLPLAGAFGFGASWATEKSLADGAKPQTDDLQPVLPAYFEVLGTPIIAGLRVH
jgi:putative ABC transport system permease protein